MESIPDSPEKSPQTPGVVEKPPKLDLSRLPEPGALEKLHVEEITIDGICGVY